MICQQLLSTISVAPKVSRPTLANHIAAGTVNNDYQVVVWSEALDGG